MYLHHHFGRLCYTVSVLLLLSVAPGPEGNGARHKLLIGSCAITHARQHTLA